MSISLKRLKKLRCRLLEKETGRPLPAVVIHLSLPADGESKGNLPVSTLRTDATGYVSFDLQPLIELGLDVVPAIHVSAPRVGLKNYDVLERLKGPANGEETRTYTSRPQTKERVGSASLFAWNSRSMLTGRVPPKKVVRPFVKGPI